MKSLVLKQQAVSDLGSYDREPDVPASHMVMMTVAGTDGGIRDGNDDAIYRAWFVRAVT